MRTSSVIVWALLLAGCATSKEPTPATKPATKEPTKETAAMTNEITITDPSQREAAVDKPVVVTGVQTRTKQPQVNGVDVDGAYALSDTKVIARGILKKTVVPEAPPSKDGLQVASRGAGTFYAVVDPQTGQLAKTKPAD